MACKRCSISDFMLATSHSYGRDYADEQINLVIRRIVGADLSRPSPIYRPAGRADKSAMGAINRPLRLFADNDFIHPLPHNTSTSDKEYGIIPQTLIRQTRK